MKTNLQTQIEKLKEECQKLSENGIDGCYAFENGKLVKKYGTKYLSREQVIKRMEKIGNKLEKLKVELRDEKIKELGI